MIVGLWLVSGLIGSLCLYLQWKFEDKNDFDFTWCPSPIEVFFILVGASLGFLILTTSFIVYIVYIVENCKKDTWLTRPICRKK